MNNENDTVKKLNKILDSLEDNTDVALFDNDKSCGFDIGWSRKGKGWGHLSWGYDFSEKRWWADTECTSEQTIAKLIRDAAPILAKRLIAIEAGEDVSNKHEDELFKTWL